MTGTRLISQKYKYDCVVACLSMITKIPHKKIIERYFKDHDFTQKGLRWGTENIVLLKENMMPQNLSNDKLPEVKAILTVDSLNYPGTYHAIVWDPNTKRKVFDPNTNNKTKNKSIKIYSLTKLKKSTLYRVVSV